MAFKDRLNAFLLYPYAIQVKSLVREALLLLSPALSETLPPSSVSRMSLSSAHPEFLPFQDSGFSCSFLSRKCIVLSKKLLGIYEALMMGYFPPLATSYIIEVFKYK